ncbi:MAG: monovalent cation/H(+) antiporter subunit G, partial [Solirubrobacteraceae bacterium]
MVWFGCLGATLMREELDRVHFLSPLTALGVPAVAAAVLVQESLISIPGVKSLLIAVVLFCAGPALNHAIARAHRIRTT